MKIGIKVFWLFIAFALAVNMLNFVVAFLPHLSIVFAVGCSLGALWGAFHHHGHGKPLMYGAIEGALWLLFLFPAAPIAGIKTTYRVTNARRFRA